MESTEPGIVEADDVAVVLRAVAGESGVDFTQYRPSTLERRIQRRAQRVGATSSADYVELVRRSRPERLALFDEVLIDVSEFFRDREVFERLESAVLPALVEHAAEQAGTLRVWSAACATGEEPYSVAMLAAETAERLGVGDLRLQIFASDVNAAAVNKASSGIYGGDELVGVSPERLERHFTPMSAGARIDPALRSMVTFTRHDLLADPGFTRLDLVLCRNVLIYLDPSAQQTVLRNVTSGLRIGGTLVLGASEDLGALGADFEPDDRSKRIFTKKRSDVAKEAMRNAMASRRSARGAGAGSPLPDQRLLRAYDAILDDYFGAGVLLGEQRELVHTFGAATSWLRQPGGRPTLDVFQLVEDPAMRMAMSSLLRDLRGRPDLVTSRPVLIDGPDGPLSADLIGRAIDVGGASYHLIHAVPATVLRAPSGVRETSGVEGDAVREADVEFLRDSLQSAIDELERSNADLAASNEELVAANEELQSANEELSSVNEELRSLNDEHQVRLHEVSTVSADLDQLLSDIDLGVLFLDRDLNVRRASDTARRFFRLRPDDVDRPLAEVVTHLDMPDLVTMAEQVMATGDTYRSRVGHLADRSMSLGVAISRFSIGDAPGGLLITVADLTPLVSMETNQTRFIRLLNRGPVAMFAKDPAGRFWFKNRMAEAFTGPGLGNTTHDSYSEELASRLVADDLLIARTGRPVQRVVSLPLGGDVVDTLVVKFPLEDGGIGGIGIELANADQLLAAAELDHLEATVEALTVAVIEQVNDTLVDRSGRFRQLTGYGPDGWLSRVHADDRGAVESALAMGDADPAFRILEADGTYRTVELRMVEGKVAGHRFLAFVDRHESATTIAALREQLRSSRELAAPSDEAATAAFNLEVLRRLDAAISGVVREARKRTTAIDTFADTVVTDLASADLEHWAGSVDQLRRLQRTNDWLARLLEGLDELGRTGRQLLGPGPASLATVVGRVLEQEREMIEAVGAEVVVGDLVEVAVDPEALAVVVQQLVRNALDHGRGSDHRVEISATVGDDGVALSVRDGGPGFEQERAVEVFKPFHRIEPTVDDSAGVGLGLTITRRLVRRLGGDIWARSAPGEGATFTVLLPPVPPAD